VTNLRAGSPANAGFTAMSSLREIYELPEHPPAP
jgi:hypothetical protein